MRAFELIEELKEGISYDGENTCDTLKAGDEGKELHRVAVTMLATVDVIKAATEWGADMIITHEPTYYDHMDNIIKSPVTEAKRTLLEKSGAVLFRYHDYMHRDLPDGITEGELHYLGLSGRLELTPYFASYIYRLDQPITALELARRIEDRLGVKQAKIAGERNKKASVLALCFGTPGSVFDMLLDEEAQIILTGEICEWRDGEYARDAAALGVNKSVIVMSHIGSERDGMRLLAEKLAEGHTEFETKYFECGEVYTYTDGI